MHKDKSGNQVSALFFVTSGYLYGPGGPGVRGFAGPRGEPGIEAAFDDGAVARAPAGPAGPGAPGPSGGPAGERGEPGAPAPAPLTPVARVRQEFPEAWIWTETQTEYLKRSF